MKKRGRPKEKKKSGRKKKKTDFGDRTASRRIDQIFEYVKSIGMENIISKQDLKDIKKKMMKKKIVF